MRGCITTRGTCWHPQIAYSGLKKYLQKEWALVQHVTPHIGESFCPSEQDLYKSFLMALFKGATTEVPPRGITCLTVNQAGMEIPNPTLNTS